MLHEENSELIRQANADVESLNGFVAGGGDNGFSKNTIDKSNDTLTFALVNPTTVKLSVSLMGMDSGVIKPINPSPIIPSPLIPLGLGATSNLNSFCIPNNTLYISDLGSDSIYVFDCNTNTVIFTVVLPVGFAPLAPCYCPVNNEVYVASNSFAQVIRIDCSTNLITGVPIITTAPFSSIQGLIYNSTKNSIYGPIGAGNQVVEISCVTNLQIALIALAVNLSSMAFNPIFNRIYFNNDITNALDVLDCNTNTFLPSIPLPITPGGIEANAYCSFNNSIYVISNITNNYVIVNCTSLNVSAPLATGVLGPNGISYNPVNNLIYIAGTTSNDYTILNVVTNVVSAPIPVLVLGPIIVYNTNNNSIYVLGLASGDIQVYAPIVPPSVVVTLQGSVTPAEIFNDLQGKPLFFSGLKMILSDLNQLFNNISVQYTSITGKINSSQLQPTNNVSPSNRNSNIVDITDFEFAADTNSQVSFDMEPLSTMTMAFSLRRQVSNVSFDSPNNNSVEKRENVRISGNPILDILLVQDEEEYQRKKSK